MSSRLRWWAVVAAALCLHLPWWPRPGRLDRMAAARQSLGPPGHRPVLLVRPALAPSPPPPSALPTPAATARPHRAAAAPTPGGGPAAGARVDGAPSPAFFVPPADTVLDYLWTVGTRTRPMQLTWSTQGMAYRMALESPPGTSPRDAGWMRSEGTWTATAGVTPQRFTAKRSGQSEQALSFLRERAADAPLTVAFSSTTYRSPVDEGAQDGVSWLPQWLGLRQAGDGRRALQVAHADGRIVTLQFEPSGDDRRHWQSTGTAPADDRIELWLSDASPHWPQRWRHTTPWGSVSEAVLVPPDETRDASAPP